MKHVYSLTRRIGLLLVCSTYLLGSATPIPADSWWSKAWNGVTSWWSSLSGTQKAVAGTAAVACVGLTCFYARSRKNNKNAGIIAGEPTITEKINEINQIFRAIQSQRDEELAASGNQDNTLSSLLKAWVNDPTKQPDALFKILVHKTQPAAATNKNISNYITSFAKNSPDTLNDFYAIIFRYTPQNAQSPYEVFFWDTSSTDKVFGELSINVIQYSDNDLRATIPVNHKTKRTHISKQTMEQKLNEID